MEVIAWVIMKTEILKNILLVEASVSWKIVSIKIYNICNTTSPWISWSQKIARERRTPTSGCPHFIDRLCMLQCAQVALKLIIPVPAKYSNLCFSTMKVTRITLPLSVQSFWVKPRMMSRKLRSIVLSHDSTRLPLQTTIYVVRTSRGDNLLLQSDLSGSFFEQVHHQRTSEEFLILIWMELSRFRERAKGYNS